MWDCVYEEIYRGVGRVKVALIAPKNLLEYTRLGDIHFIIPMNVQASFFLREKKYKMLDNGTYETGQPKDIEDLIKMAHCLNADEIVLPDIMRNRKMTTSLTMHAVRSIKPKGMKFAAVPQGADPADFIQCYRDFAKVPEIDVLCFPIWLQKAFNARPMVVNKLVKRKWLADKEHHLIGLDSPSELYCYTYGLIRSVDTSLPFSAGAIQYAMRDFDTFRGDRVNLEGSFTFNSTHHDYIKWNIRILLEAAKYA